MEKHQIVWTVSFECMKRAFSVTSFIHFQEGLLVTQVPQCHLAISTKLEENTVHYY